jgi:hypothetical protein
MCNVRQFQLYGQQLDLNPPEALLWCMYVCFCVINRVHHRNRPIYSPEHHIAQCMTLCDSNSHLSANERQYRGIFLLLSQEQKGEESAKKGKHKSVV